MKPEELQIGDWVLWKNKPVQIAQISGIKYSFGHIDVVLAHCNDGNILESHDIKSIEPIPINPEILLKNGFLQGKNSTINYYYYYDKTSIGVTFYESCILVKIETYCKTTNGVNRLHNCDIKYIHQLQQAMRLCGIGKEIKL